MTIVFDEVTGSVEPREGAREREAAPEPRTAGAEASPLDEARMSEWLRRRAWLEARRRAD
jgi:hypothetical protein